jgi:hypothetical protein
MTLDKITTVIMALRMMTLAIMALAMMIFSIKYSYNIMLSLIILNFNMLNVVTLTEALLCV